MSAASPGLTGASVSTRTHRLYVGRGDGVMAVDLDGGKITPTFVTGSRVHGVLPAGDTGLVISANGAANTATIFEDESGKAVATVATGENPDTVAFDSKSGLAAIVDADGGDIALIDPAKRAVAGRIAVSGKLEFAQGDGRGMLYVNIEDKNEIAVVDVTARKVTRTYALAGCDGPTGLAYDEQDGLLISVCANGVAKVLRASDGAEMASLPVGEGPDAAIFDAARRLVFVPSGRAGTLTEIAIRGANDIAVVQTIDTQRGTRTGAFDPKTGNLYLPTAQFTPPAKPGERPQPVPGTFELLVVATR